MLSSLLCHLRKCNFRILLKFNDKEYDASEDGSVAKYCSENLDCVRFHNALRFNGGTCLAQIYWEEAVLYLNTNEGLDLVWAFIIFRPLNKFRSD